MDEPNRNAMTSEELWEFCLREYNSTSPLTRFLLDRFFRRVGQLLQRLDPADRVLEVGCGAGASSLRIKSMLHGRYFEVSEFDERYIVEMRKREFPILASQESVYELHRDDETFDCVIMLEVLEHLDDYERALSEMFRVSRKYVILSVPHEPLWRMLNISRGKYVGHWGNTPGHINHWTPWGLRRLVARYGVVERVYMPVPWTLLLARKHDGKRSTRSADD